MDFLILGTFTSDKIRQHLNNQGARQEPGDIVQKYIIKALSKNLDNHISFICSPRIEGFPKCRVKRLSKECFSFEGANGISVGYTNIGITGLFFREKNFVKECKKWAKQNANIEPNIIVYSLNSTFLKGAQAIKKIIPSANICAIVPDLPEYMSKYKWPISLIKKRDIKRINILRRAVVDFYSLYTDSMAKELSIPKSKYVVIEGFVNQEKINLQIKNKHNEKKVCLYAGDLHSIYGIQALIDAFENINCECELHLYGNETLAKEYKYNKNTKYCGLITPDEVFKKMMDCDLLINPRPSTLKLAAFSFPSKTFEYMASGTPCLMCRLPGIPEEYFNYIYCFHEETVQGMKADIEEVLSKPDQELWLKGHQAALFLMNNKTSEQQMKKIIGKFKMCRTK